MDTARRARAVAAGLAFTLVALAGWAVAIGRAGAACPAEGAFSCVTLVRPALATLGPVPVLGVLALGAAAEAAAALLLLARGARLPFARDVSILAALGAGFALGVQPLALLAAKRACLVCGLALATQLALALVLASVARGAGARLRASGAAFLLALIATATVASLEGTRLAREDDARRAALERLVRSPARLVLVVREGCPYCEALELDVLARPEILARLEKVGLERRVPAPGEPTPIIIARDASGREVARQAGFSPDPAVYEPVLAAAER